MPKRCVVKEIFISEWRIGDVHAYAKLYPNNGAMTKGVTDETVDGMSIQKIDRMIEILREEKYQWKPARREYIKKKNGKKRPLGIPVWGDKVLQEVMRQILEAYYEPQFSEHSHVMESGQVVENPMIGAIPSRNEVQRELDDLLMSM